MERNGRHSNTQANPDVASHLLSLSLGTAGGAWLEHRSPLTAAQRAPLEKPLQTLGQNVRSAEDFTSRWTEEMFPANEARWKVNPNDARQLDPVAVHNAGEKLASLRRMLDNREWVSKPDLLRKNNIDLFQTRAQIDAQPHMAQEFRSYNASAAAVEKELRAVRPFVSTEQIKGLGAAAVGVGFNRLLDATVWRGTHTSIETEGFGTLLEGAVMAIPRLKMVARFAGVVGVHQAARLFDSKSER